MDSDSESDFYGDVDELGHFEYRLSCYDPSTYWLNRKRLTMEVPSFSPPPQQSTSTSSSTASPQKLHNPYEGRPHCAKQLFESPQAFVSRLPPSTTDQSLENGGIPWIYVANPFIPRQGAGGDNWEEEAPAESGMQLGGFTQGGRERLELLGDFLRTVEAKGTRGLSNRDKTVLNREVAQERDGAVKDVLMLARMLKVRTGKWMLFIPPAQIDAVWSLIVHATCQNELGIAAKVAPRPSPLETVHDRERLICVYTYDFSDKEDVARVLVRLKELDLVKSSGGKPIYYKTDAYTHLGIGSGNPWGLRASLYSSRDIFAEINKKQGKQVQPQSQSQSATSRPPPTAPKGMRQKQEEKSGGDAMDWTF